MAEFWVRYDRQGKLGNGVRGNQNGGRLWTCSVSLAVRPNAGQLPSLPAVGIVAGVVKDATRASCRA
jgi:hypothetical protein